MYHEGQLGERRGSYLSTATAVQQRPSTCYNGQRPDSEPKGKASPSMSAVLRRHVVSRLQTVRVS